ncbi:Rab family GTPase [Legionella sp. PC997]|uniref:Rab family GTPase n=1 Tax=Legionella sp. PC997 TaxID=2755562 RepID=UPI0015F80B4E|nr:Rab family GTPase [Legionella sp. PC997]QMT61761.1 Ras family GTPase [Legionella sp. PC997]
MERKQEYDEHFKIILLGNNAVGKSCLVQAYCGGSLYSYDTYMDTMGVDQEIKWIKLFNKKVQLRIWDASGTPKLQEIVGSYFRSVDGALVCFDLTNKTSLQHTKDYVARLRVTKQNLPMILVGCKADIEKRREVSSTQAKGLADELGLEYLEVSSRNKMNVEQLFYHITLRIYLAKHLNKIKPLLDEFFNNYLKLTNPNRTHLFTEKHQNLVLKGETRAEYNAQFEKLFASTNVDEVIEFCRTTLDLMEQANNFYKQDSPVLSTFLTSPLASIFKEILEVVSTMLSDMMGFVAARELIYQKKSIEHAF